MSPKPLNSDGKKEKNKTREQLITELAGLRDMVRALKGEQAGCDRIVGMLDDIPEPILVLDDGAQVVYANSAAGRLLDTIREELPGKRLWDVYPKSKDTLFYNVFMRAAANRNPASLIEKHQRQAKWSEVYLYPVAGGMVILFQDVTTRRHKDELQRLALVLLHHLKENIFLLRADGRLFHVNDETRHSLGYSTDEFVRMSIFDLVPQAYLSQWHDILDRIKQRGSATFESKLQTKDGREFPVEVYANYIELYGRDYYTISARDITERKQAELERALLASIVDTTREAIVSITPEGVITSWNRGAEKLYGYTAEETTGNHAAMLAPPDRQAEIAEKLKKMRSDGQPIYYETVRLRKDGTLIDISLTLSPIVDASGAFVGSSAIVHDITESKRNERALKESEANLSQAQRMAHIGNWTWDTKADRIYCSDEFFRIFGMIRQDFINYGQFIDTVNPEDRDSVNTAVDTTLRKGEYYKIDYRVIWPDGAEHTVHAEGEVHLDAAGKPDRMFGTVQDVTERKKAEAVLEKYLLFAENAHDIVLFIQRDGRILEANAAAVKAYGYTYEELLSLSIYDLRASDIGYHSDEQMDMAYNNGILFEAMHRRKDGSDFSVEVSSQGKVINGQRIMLSVVRDITERKRAEEALRETRDYLESLIDFANAPIIVWDPKFTITRFNHAFERLSGYAAGEVVGMNLKVLFPPDSLDESLDKILGTLTGERWESVEIPILCKDGSVRIALWNSANIHGERGDLLATIAQGQDITGRKQAEEALQVAKAQAELYVDLMGHDINNMNQVAMASLELALMDLEQDGKLDASGIPLLEKSMESLNNSSQLIRNVQKLQLASTEGIRLQAVDVADVLKGIIDEERSTPGKDVTIYYKNAATSCRVTANELLRDVFTNLIGNAIKHSGPEKHLTIGIAVDSVEEGGKKLCRVAIEDNGPGIPDGTKEKLFSRFARGATKARGSGLGLYLVRTLVEHYGGSIAVADRVPGDFSKGAKFIIAIPSSE